MTLSVFILAGGKSTRMGSDKAFLELAGRSLLDRAVDLAHGISQQVIIVGDRTKFAAFGCVIEDTYSGRGPLAGIHAALEHSQTDCNLILGVDMPFVDSSLLKYVAAEAEKSCAMVTVPFANGHYQTLCAVYRKKFAPIAEAALCAGRNKIDALFRNIPVRVIAEDELTRAGFCASAFRNVNTPEEWSQAVREFESQARPV
jgi:molybdopterin-guanine dinucleotide biosynthesis protein A